MPDRIRMQGEWIAPAQSTTSRRRDLLPRLPESNAHAARAAALEQHAIDQRAAADGQVRPPARRFQVAVIGRDALAHRAG
jgi:hypothetical protein